MMDFGRELWAAYLGEHCSKEPQAMENADAGTVAGLLWSLNSVFRARASIIGEAPYNDAFVEDADKALIDLAITGNFDGWERLTLGAWRVLIARHCSSITALMLEEAAGTDFKIPLPRDAPEPVRAIAALLCVLGGMGREPLPAWRAAQSGSELAQFLQAPLRPQ